MKSFYFFLFVFITFSIRAQDTGKKLFEVRCNFCHNGTVKEAPTIASLSLMSTSSISQALLTGVMKTQAAGLSTSQIEEIAQFLSKKELSIENVDLAVCAEEVNFSNEKPIVSSWGMNMENSRYFDKDVLINKDNISQLKLKWVFAFDNSTRARVQPTVTDKYIFTADQNGIVYTLDRLTGCVLWTFNAEAEVRSSIVIGTDSKGIINTIYFGDFKANVYAIDINTQKLLWKKKMDDHVAATITGTPSLYNGILYVPISSIEVGYAMNPAYECCTFRGAVAAVASETGDSIWRTAFVDESQNVNQKGAKYGPSGAPVWSSPTIDVDRGLIYIGTGENYSNPPTGTSDAIIALDLENGEIKWIHQTVSNDAWNGACPGNENCPENFGPDYDFGAPPILVKRKGKKDIILAGQKSGMVYGIDPENGREVWRTKVGRGGIMGGVHWGMATNGKQLFVPINDQSVYDRDKNKPTKAGLHALNIYSGKIIWSKLEKNRCEKDLDWNCYPGLSAAITAIPTLIFGGALDGIVHAYDLKKGEIVWEFDTNVEFKSVNGPKAFGGSIDSTGPVIVGSQMFVNSGYAKFGEKAGNVLLCFELNGL